MQKANGETFPATAMDISSSGMLLHVGLPCPLDLGEEVNIEVDLPDSPDKALSVWGLAKVVRLDAAHSAVQLRAGSFHGDAGELPQAEK